MTRERYAPARLKKGYIQHIMFIKEKEYPYHPQARKRERT